MASYPLPLPQEVLANQSLIDLGRQPYSEAERNRRFLTPEPLMTKDEERWKGEDPRVKPPMYQDLLYIPDTEMPVIERDWKEEPMKGPHFYEDTLVNWEGMTHKPWDSGIPSNVEKYINQVKERITKPEESFDKAFKEQYGGTPEEVARKVIDNFGGMGTIGGKMSRMVENNVGGLADSLKKAYQDLNEGKKTIQEIYEDTKWYLGSPDVQPRFEFADNMARVNVDTNGFVENSLKAFRNGDSYVTDLTDVFHHTTLYQHYPQLKRFKLQTYYDPKGGEAWYQNAGIDNRGKYVPDTIGINMAKAPNRQQLKEWILHEVNHAISNIEGRAGGANTEGFRRSYDKLNRKFNDIDYVYKDPMAREMAQFRGQPEMLKRIRAKDPKRFEGIQDKVRRNGYRGVTDAMQDYERLKNQVETYTPEEVYQRFLDEVQSRMVERRSGMTQKQLWDEPFFRDKAGESATALNYGRWGQSARDVQTQIHPQYADTPQADWILDERQARELMK